MTVIMWHHVTVTCYSLASSGQHGVTATLLFYGITQLLMCLLALDAKVDDATRLAHVMFDIVNKIVLIHVTFVL